MTRSKWYILKEEGALTVARNLPVRFDFSAQVVLPRCGKRRLAMQIRQDMWRLLQNLRGFSPVVRVEDAGENLCVTAGGKVDQRRFPSGQSEEKVRDMLGDRANRARWVAHARGVCYE